jgi:hypothetical protein
VTAFAHEFAGLEGAFHGSKLQNVVSFGGFSSQCQEKIFPFFGSHFLILVVKDFLTALCAKLWKVMFLQHCSRIFVNVPV